MEFGVKAKNKGKTGTKDIVRTGVYDAKRILP